MTAVVFYTNHHSTGDIVIEYFTLIIASNCYCYTVTTVTTVADSSK